MHAAPLCSRPSRITTVALGQSSPLKIPPHAIAIMNSTHSRYMSQTITHEALNCSPSKQKYSFAKDARFRRPSGPTPSEFNETLPDTLGRRSPGFGIGNRFQEKRRARKYPVSRLCRGLFFPQTAKSRSPASQVDLGLNAAALPALSVNRVLSLRERGPPRASVHPRRGVSPACGLKTRARERLTAFQGELAAVERLLTC